MKKLLPILTGMIGLFILGYIFFQNILPNLQEDEPVIVAEVDAPEEAESVDLSKKIDVSNQEMAMDESAMTMHSGVYEEDLEETTVVLDTELPAGILGGTTYVAKAIERSNEEILAIAQQVGIVNPTIWEQQYMHEEEEEDRMSSLYNQYLQVYGDNEITMNVQGGGIYNVVYSAETEEPYMMGPPTYENFPDPERLKETAINKLTEMGLLPELYTVRLGSYSPSVIVMPLIDGQPILGGNYNPTAIEVTFLESGEISGIQWGVYELVTGEAYAGISAEDAYNQLAEGKGYNVGSTMTYLEQAELYAAEVMIEQEAEEMYKSYHSTGSNTDQFVIGEEISVTGYVDMFLINKETGEKRLALYGNGSSNFTYHLSGSLIESFEVGETPMVSVVGNVTAIRGSTASVEVSSIEAQNEEYGMNYVCLRGEITQAGETTIFRSDDKQQPYLSWELQMKRAEYSGQEYILENVSEAMTVGEYLEVCGIQKPLVAGQPIVWESAYTTEQYEISDSEYESNPEYDPELMPNPREFEGMPPMEMPEFVSPFEIGEQVDIDVLVEAYISVNPDMTDVQLELIHFHYDPTIPSTPYGMMEPSIIRLLDANGDPISIELQLEIAEYGKQYISLNGTVVPTPTKEDEDEYGYENPYTTYIQLDSYTPIDEGTPKNYYGTISTVDVEGNEYVLFTESNTAEKFVLPMIPPMMVEEWDSEPIIVVASVLPDQQFGEYPVGNIHDVIDYGLDEISSADQYPAPDLGPERYDYTDEPTESPYDNIFYAPGENRVIAVEFGYALLDPYEKLHRMTPNPSPAMYEALEEAHDPELVPAWIFTVMANPEYGQESTKYMIPATP